MLVVVILLVVLLLLGYLPLDALKIPLFSFNGQVIDLWNLFIFLIIIYLVSALPRPFREIASALLVLWLLAIFGIIAIANFSNIVVITLVVGLIVYLVSRKS